MGYTSKIYGLRFTHSYSRALCVICARFTLDLNWMKSEICRREKVIGHSLDAHVQIVLPEKLRTLLQDDLEELKIIFIVSRVDVVDDLSAIENAWNCESLKGVVIAVSAVGGEKCERCWNYFDPKTGEEPASALCEKCVENLEYPKRTGN